MKKFILFTILVLFASRLLAADYYWVNGAGSWSDINHWSTTSGGPANQSIIPNLNDDVFFDANSGLADNAVVTMPSSGHAYCRNMSWVGVTTRAIFRNLATFQLMVYGNLELSSTVRYDTRDITFSGNSNATLKMNGAGYFLAASNSHNNLIINKPGGSLTMLDGVPAALVVWYVTLVEGHLDMSDNTHTFLNFNGLFASTRSLDISNATLNISDSWDFSNATGTLNATGSYIIAQNFNSDRHTFPKVDITGASVGLIISNTTFGELTFTNALAPTGSSRIVGNNTIDRLEFKGGGRIAGGGNSINKLILAPGKGYVFHGNNTINELMQLNAPDCEALGELSGADLNAKLTFGAGAVADIRNVYIKSLTAAGSITPISVVGADGGDNNGWNIQPRASGTTLYWVGGAGNWNDKSHWAASSGGAAGYCVPFTGDNVVFDANSGFTAVSKTVSFTGNAWCHNMTWTGVAAAPVFSQPNIYQLEVWGSIVLDPTMTLNGNLVLKGTEMSTLTTNGCSTGTVTINVSKDNVSGGLTVMDDINFPLLSFLHTRGNLSMAGRNINMYVFNSTSGLGRIIDISNSTILVTYWNLGATNVTWSNNAAGSFITSTRGFTANGLTYPKVHSATNLDEASIQNTTINELVFTNTSPTSALITLLGNNVIGTLDIRSGGAEIRGNNTITNLLLTPSRTYYLRNTQTINGLLRFNNPACNGLGELKGIAGTGATLNFGASATRDFNNVYLQNVAATGSGVPITVAGADAGGNTGFTITPSDSGPRYWVGGSGDWNQSAHWSNTSGGPGGACVPTVTNDVFFDGNSFSSGSSAVTVSQGNAYCNNMSWAGATFAPVFNKNAALGLEIWGNLIMNPAVRMNALLAFTGATNSTITPNGSTLGDLDINVLKPTGSTLTFAGNFSNGLTRIELRSGGLDVSGRTLVLNSLVDVAVPTPTSLNITNANINAAWQYQGAAKSLQAAGSVVTGSWFSVNGGTYNQVNVTTYVASQMAIVNTTIADLLFSNPNATSGAFIQGNNTIGRLEFKGKGYIGGTGNTIGTLIFSPGMTYTFLAGSNTTITSAWFGSGTPCNPTQIVSSSTTTATVTKTSGTVDFDYVRLNYITAAGVTPFKAGEHSTDLGGNVNWAIAPYNGTAIIVGLGPDKVLSAGEFPYTIRTDGFFASPLAQFQWKKGATVVGTGSELVITTPGTYTVNVTYPDGCASTDQIVITQAAANLSVVNTVDKPAPVFGTEVVFTIVATNNGPQQSGGITLTDLLPAGYTYKSSTPPAGTAYDAATGIWNIGTLASGANATLTITAVVKATGPYVTTATIAGPETDAVPANNSATAGTVPVPAALSVVKGTEAAEPGTNGSFAISLPAGVTISEDITVSYTVGGTATAPGDYTALSGTATIAAGQNSVSIPVSVQNDALIESAETVIITLSAGTSANYTFPISGTAGSATVQITDDDNIPANRVLSVTAQGSVSEPAINGTFTVALPAGVLAPEDITVNYTMGGTSANVLDYESLPGTVIIPAGQNSAVINVKAVDDQIMETTETIQLTLTGGTTATAGSFTVSATNAASLNIADDDNTIANRVLAIAKTADAAEPGTNGTFSISLPAGITASQDITANYTVSGNTTAGTDYTALSGTVIIPAGQNNVNVSVSVIDDQSIESPETVAATLTGGTSGLGSFAVSSSSGNATLNIADNDFSANSKIVLVTKVSDAVEGGTTGQYTISLPPGVTSSEDVTVVYTLSGNAINPTDYTLQGLSGSSIVIPAGANSVVLDVNAVTDGIIEGPEDVILTLTGATSPSYTYNISTSSGNATVNIIDADGTNSTLLEVIAGTNAQEPAANGSFTVKLAGATTSVWPITVGYTLSGTVASGIDYQSFGTITIPANQNSVIVPIKAIDDKVIEPTENMTFTLISGSAIGGGSAYVFPPDPVKNNITATITDDDATAANRVLSIVKTTDAAEPGTNGSFTVSLPAGYTSASDITVSYSRGGTAATDNTDYTIAGTIKIPANSNSVTIPVNVVADIVAEPTETVILTLNNSTDATFTYAPSSSNNAATVDITDGNAASRIVSVSSPTNVNEALPLFGHVIINIGIAASEDVTVTYTLGGTATPGTDYTGYTGTLIFPAGTIGQFHSYTPLPDEIIEGNETIIFTLTGATTPSGLTYTLDPSRSTVTLRITDDDNTPANRVLAITKNTDAAEPSTAGSFTISLPAGVTATEDITANYSIAGTATAGTDYTTLAGTVVIPAGQNSVTLPVTALDDQLIEGNETIIASITGGSSATFGSFTPSTTNGSATMTIADDDNTPANRVVSIVKHQDAAEPSTGGSFTISLPAGITAKENVTVNYTVAGTATSNTDYSALSGTALIPAGQNSVEVSVSIKDDQLIENNETIIASITGGTSPTFGSFTPGSTNIATMIITDDDNTPANRTVRVLAVRDGAEGGSTLRFNFQLPDGITSSEQVTIHYTVGGTATPGADYNGAPTPAQFSGTAKISAGAGGGIAAVASAVDDLIIEGTETVVVTITDASSASFTFAPDPVENSATVNITDNDEDPASLTLSIVKTADGAEPGTNGAFQVSLPAGVTASEDITVSYTASGTATSGTDYTALTGTVVIPAGQNGVPIRVFAIDDQVIENDETVDLTLTGGASASFAFTPDDINGSASLNITDDDNTAANGVLTIVKTADGAEPSTNGLFTVSLPVNVVASEDIVVNYTTGGTAISGADYTALPGIIIIPAGQNSVTIPVGVINDGVIEGSETVVLTLTNANSTSYTFNASGTSGSATVNITDGNAASMVISVASTAGVAEGSGGSFTISLPAGVTATEDITVTYTTGGTATAGTDYTALSGTAVIPAGQSSVAVAVNALADSFIENTETVAMTINGGTSASGTFAASNTSKSATVNITDGNAASMVISVVGTADAAEGSGGSFTISLPGGVTATEDITISYAAGGTATAGTDYTALSGTAVIPAGQNSVAVAVNALADSFIENTETVVLSVTGATSASGTFTAGNTNSSATLNITDGGGGGGSSSQSISIAKNADAAEPSANGSFTISLAPGVTATEDVTVNYTVAGTATSGTDYTAFTGTAVIPAGQNSVLLPVRVVDDNQVEGSETVAITLTGGSSANFSFTAGPANNAAVTIADNDVAANPLLGVAFAATEPQSQNDGSLLVTYTLRLKNMGDVMLAEVQVPDDLKAVFPAPVDFSLDNSVQTSGGLNANSNYNGRADINLLSAGSKLNIGEEATITFVVKIKPNGYFTTFINSVKATATANGVGVTAQSVNGISADVNGDGQPDPPSVTPVTVKAIPIHIPNVFTPNGDGKNETLVIRNLQLYAENQLTIINRWGNTVFDKKNYQNDWTAEGLSEGTYYYLLKLKVPNGGWEIQKGYITLIRSK
jgi:gliding motility-associated-like protein/uncharacterized repeat protein (TIGR01451 family)